MPGVVARGFWGGMLLLFGGLWGADATAAVWYVDIDNVSGTCDGLSWATAFTNIQAAVDAAYSSGGGEIWVAEGTYTGTTDPVLTMKTNVHIYGGFVGNETARDQRSWTAHVTVIDGQNARRCVVGANIGTLDGLTITKGSADNGGGMLNNSSSPTIRNCTFSTNSGYCGGGLCNMASSSPTIERTEFIQNSVGGYLGRGAGLFNGNYCAPQVTNCRFHGNNASDLGGGIYNEGGSSPQITGCVFTGNSTSEGGNGTDGGGGMASVHCSVEVTNSVFYANHANAAGGALHIRNVTMTLINTTIYGNTCGNPNSYGNSSGIAIGDNNVKLYAKNCIVYNNGISSWYDTIGIEHSCIEGGFPGTGNISTSPLFVDAGHGDFRLSAESPCVDSGTLSLAPIADIQGTPRPSGSSIDMGAYEYLDNIPTDEDGLPESSEESQGCDPDIHDAYLEAVIHHPSPGAVFASAPIQLEGTISSPYINAIFLGIDNQYFQADISGLRWTFDWNSAEPGNHTIWTYATNIFGGGKRSLPINISLRPNSPTVNISSPLAGSHLKDTVAIKGTVQPSSMAELDAWVLEYRAGELDVSIDEDTSSTGWIEITQGSSAVNDDTLANWDVSAVLKGPYMVRLRVEAMGGLLAFASYVPVSIVHDMVPPDPPAVISIAGAVLAGVVADGNMVNVNGTAQSGTHIAAAEIVDSQNMSVLSDATEQLTEHHNGSIRGNVILPNSISASNLLLRLRVSDEAGSVSSWRESNILAVDNSPPQIMIGFPLQNSYLPLSQNTVLGMATDIGSAGIEKVELSSDSASWTLCSGTDAWSSTWTPVGNGDHTLYIRGTDRLGNVSIVQTQIHVNENYPAVYITEPRQGSTINEGSVITVLGTASDSDLQSYQVRWAKGVSPSSGFTTIANVTSPVHDGILAVWDTNGLEEGIHTLRLTAIDAMLNFVRFDMTVMIRARLSLADVPDQTLSEDTTRSDAAHLPDYCSALAGDRESFAYTIIGNTNPNCGVSIDANRNLDIHPAANWNGTSTVTIQVSNGVLTNTDDIVVTVNPVNDLPSAPGVVIAPADPLDDDPLACTIATPSTDPDTATNGQVIGYAYAWYASTNLSAAIGTASTLEASATSPGVAYTCVVTPNDGVANGATGQATARVRSMSTITAAVQPTTLTLGQSARVTGAISATGGLGTVVSFTSTRPDGGTVSLPAGVSIGALEYSQHDFYPDRAGAWSLTAQWPGDTVCRGATSAPVAFSVEKAQPSLQVTLDASSAPLNYAGLRVAVALDASLPVSLRSLLSGRTIKVYAQKPDLTVLAPVTAQTDSDGKAALSGAALAAWVFDTPGTWKFTASFDGDSDFLAAASAGVDRPECPRLTIKDRAGYAIIVVGRLDGGGEGLKEHAKTGDFVYRCLRDRGFAAEDINYLRGTVPGYAAGPDITVSATAPSQAGVESAITGWALAKMTATPAPLYVVLVDHGSANEFYVYSGSFDETRVISPVELSGYLTSLENGLATAGKPAQDTILVYGACHSGSFTQGLASHSEGRRRTIVTSTAPDEVSYRGVEADGVRDGEAFVTELFRQLASGKTLKASFELASGKIAEYTAESTNGVQGTHAQTPQLDDNGDGVAASGTALSFTPGEDGARAHETVLGYGVNAGASASWVAATPTVTLAAGDSLGSLWALCDKRPLTGLSAWIEVKTPAYSGGTPVSTEPNAQEEVDLCRLDYEPDSSDLAAGYFRWTSFGDLFDAPGAYKVFYYVKDGESVSSHLVTTVYRMAEGNHAPGSVSLLSPADGAETKSTVLLAWEPATDPDGDRVTYRVEVSSDAVFSESALIVKEGVIDRFVVLTPDDGLQDRQTYYWRAIAVDAYGAQSFPSASRHFLVWNDNASLPGWVSGQVRNTDTGTGIEGVTVELGGTETVTDADGAFLFLQVVAGTYVLRCESNGYDADNQSLVVTAGFGVQRNLSLTKIPPALHVAPASRQLSFAVGTTSFDVTNTGAGTMAWTASVTQGSEWLHIVSGANGTDAGSIAVSCDANNGTSRRTGTVTVSAPSATGSPVSVDVVQLGLSPTVVLTSTASEPTNQAPIPVVVTFSEPVTGFVVSDLSVGNGTATGFTGSGASYAVNITPAGQGAVTVQVPFGVAVDADSLGNSRSDTLSRVYDNVRPTATLASSTSGTVNAPIAVTVTLSESATDFAASDIVFANASVDAFAGRGASYTFTLTPIIPGAFSCSIGVNAFRDPAGNWNEASNTLTRTYDNIGPWVSLASTSPEETNVSPIHVTATLSESCGDFTAQDIVVTGATLNGFAGSGSAYEFDLVPTGADVRVSVSVAAGAFHDAGSNSSVASNAFTRHYDSVPPGAPRVTGTTPTGDTTPTWSWVSGANGNGTYRYELVSGKGWTDTTSTTYTHATPLADGVYTLNVQERDAAGNWSPSGSFSITVASHKTLSGRITYNGTGLGSVALNGLPTATHSEGQGYYQCTVSADWSGTVTPALAGYTFSPPSRTYPSDSATGQDYTASCTALSVPAGVQATDGTESSCVRVSWTGVSGAAGYDVYRSETSDSKTAQKLNVSPVTTQSYSDTTAAPPEVTSGNGCSSGETVAYFHYFYWVKALGANPCNASALSASDEGYRGRASAKALYETVLPKADADGFVQIAGTETRLCVRLRSIVPIAPDSVWGMVTSSSVWKSNAVTWVPVSDTDGWVVYVPDRAWTAGETISMTVGAADTKGVALPFVSVQYAVAAEFAAGAVGAKVEQPLQIDGTETPQLRATSADGVTVTESVDGDAGTTGAYDIGPDEAFLAPQHIRLPIPQGADPSHLALYYLFDGEWVTADRVEGLTVPDSTEIADENGPIYYGVTVRHGGVLRLGAVAQPPVQASEAGVLTTGPGFQSLAGDLLALALAVVTLLTARGRRTKRV